MAIIPWEELVIIIFQNVFSIMLLCIEPLEIGSIFNGLLLNVRIFHLQLFRVVHLKNVLFLRAICSIVI